MTGVTVPNDSPGETPTGVPTPNDIPGITLNTTDENNNTNEIVKSGKIKVLDYGSEIITKVGAKSAKRIGM